ncbi:MAG: rhodanese-like domain-containing protein, partial [Planctomycetota bacterium]|nr:rhodanese-like domain-containing protein [Planctomycetota bacterium]
DRNSSCKPCVEGKADKSFCGMLCDPAKCKDLKPQSKCPIMGKEINRDLYVDAGCCRIYVCCKYCVEKVKADPAAAIRKIIEAGERPECLPSCRCMCCRAGGEIRCKTGSEGKCAYPCGAACACPGAEGRTCGCGSPCGQAGACGPCGPCRPCTVGKSESVTKADQEAKGEASKPSTGTGVKHIKTDELAALIASGKPVVILDARTGKWNDGRRIPGAKSLAPDASAEDAAKAIPAKDSPVVTYCGGPKCPASAKLAERLRNLGYTNVMEYHEGIQGWADAGKEIVKAGTQ